MTSVGFLTPTNESLWTDYRFKKLDEGDAFSALILATAGVKRMGWEHRISQVAMIRVSFWSLVDN